MTAGLIEDREDGAAIDGMARADVWLWRARFFKSRSAAGKFVRGERVRVQRGGEMRRLRRAATQLRPGDVLTFAKGGHTICVRVLGPGLRRGPAGEAAALYETVDLAAAST